MRKVCIGDINGKAAECRDFLQRHSEDRLVFTVASNTSVTDQQLNTEDNRHKMLYLVPFLYQYQDKVLFVESTFESKIDVDMLFSYRELNNLGPRVYYVRHHAWLIDCSDASNQTLNPFYIQENDRFKLQEEFPFEVVDKI